MTGFGISGIGAYPMMGLGNMGLGVSGAYGSYDNYMPSMMGMNGSVFGMNPMMSMYNPAYYTQMQNMAEEMQLQHAGNMHAGVLNNEVKAHRETNQALINKILTDSDVQLGIQNLCEEVRKGSNQDAVCKEFNELKDYVLNTYKDELAARSDKIVPEVSAVRIIESVYYNMTKSKLLDDIKRYGETATMNGFMNGFRKDHSERYVDDTINHIYGNPVDERKSKELRKEIATYAGRGASMLEKGAIGAGAGVAVAGTGILLNSLLTPKCIREWVGGLECFANASKWGTLKKFGKWGALAGMALDVWWQLSDNKAAA